MHCVDEDAALGCANGYKEYPFAPLSPSSRISLGSRSGNIASCIIYQPESGQVFRNSVSNHAIYDFLTTLSSASILFLHFVVDIRCIRGGLHDLQRIMFLATTKLPILLVDNINIRIKPSLSSTTRDVYSKARFTAIKLPCPY